MSAPDMQNATITVHRTMGRSLQVFALAFVIVLGVVAVRIPHWIPKLCAAICALVALGLLFFRETHIDLRRKVATEITRLLGFIQMGNRERPFAEFQAVHCFCHGSSDGVATWVVALRPRRGHEIWLRQFSTGASEDCPAARDFAQDLSDATGLELQQDAT
jgi:hypothetical protein